MCLRHYADCTVRNRSFQCGRVLVHRIDKERRCRRGDTEGFNEGETVVRGEIKIKQNQVGIWALPKDG